MPRSPLVVANRRLLDAIERPPDTGVEDRLDRLAATVWEKAGDGSPDPGTCCRLRQKLRRLEARTDGGRAREIRRARRRVDEYGARLDSV